MIYVAALLLLLQLIQVLILLQGYRRTRQLPTETPHRETWPRVSILIPARDEEAEIEQALRSVLALDYPDREIVVINDRSTDDTGPILARLSSEHPELKVVTVETLPAGWIGKNHALHVGAQSSTGELLLFTDADVSFSPAALRKAVSALEDDRLDHLTVGPRMWSRSLWVGLLIGFFGRAFTVFFRPWEAIDPRSKCYVVLGAFNLVRRRVYEQLGGHRRIALRPDDDMKLGKIIKEAGFRQDIRHGQEEMSVPWYPTVGAFVRGLEKNVLAGVDYRVIQLFFNLTLALMMLFAPWVLLALGDWPTQAVAGAALFLSFASFAVFLRLSGVGPWWAILEPVVGLIFVYTFARSVILTKWRGGIYWRDTFYPLEEMRRNEV